MWSSNRTHARTFNIGVEGKPGISLNCEKDPNMGGGIAVKLGAYLIRPSVGGGASARADDPRNPPLPSFPSHLPQPLNASNIFAFSCVRTYRRSLLCAFIVFYR